MQTERTTLNLPKPLIHKLQKELGVKTQTEAIIIALKDTLTRRRLTRLTHELGGSGGLDLTQKQLKKMRRPRFQ